MKQQCEVFVLWLYCYKIQCHNFLNLDWRFPVVTNIQSTNMTFFHLCDKGQREKVFYPVTEYPVSVTLKNGIRLYLSPPLLLHFWIGIFVGPPFAFITGVCQPLNNRSSLEFLELSGESVSILIRYLCTCKSLGNYSYGNFIKVF